MKKNLLTFFILLISFSAISQFKNISGVVYDNSTQLRIEGVSIAPPFYDTTYISNKKGKYNILMPKNYFDTLVFTHPDYYPMVKRIGRGSNLKLNSIVLIPRSLQIDTACYSAYKENRLLSGEITDDYRDELLANAVISLDNNQKLTYTNVSGRFSVGIPNTTKQVMISHPDFQPQMVSVMSKKRNIRSIDVKLTRVRFNKEDTLWKSYKNIIAVSVNELLTGSIGIRYQRFLRINHAIGVYTSSYLYGFMPGYMIPGSKFTGIKVAPYYRFYMRRNINNGVFVEGKPIVGYFDFSELYYAYKADGRYGEHVSEQFWTFGFGGAIGWSSLLPYRKNAFMTISVGFQYLPMKVPQSIESQKYGTIYVSNSWWYFAGAGSVIEFKFAFGGIF